MGLKKQYLSILSAFLLVSFLVGNVQLQAAAQASTHSVFAPLQFKNGFPGGQSTSSVSTDPPITNHSLLLDPAYVAVLTSGGDSISANGNLSSLTFPIRAAFYYPWYPESWTQKGTNPYSNYIPALGYYDLSDQGIIREQINAMLYARIQAGIAAWWGQGSPTDQRIPLLFSAAAGTSFKWAIYYEKEGRANLDPSVLNSDLVYIQKSYSNDPGYLHIDGRFVVFVYNNSRDGCDVVDRWKQANTVNAYVVLKSFPGYQSCTNQPDGWHQYAPSKAESAVSRISFTISPGYWKVGGKPLLDRSLQEWQQNVKDMIASRANFQLISTFNNWGDGTAIEPANQWDSSTGYGAYLDVLHDVSLFNKHYPLPAITQGSEDPIVFAAGDIADCKSNGDILTAELMKDTPATVITLGNNAYESGSAIQFDKCYDPTWGQFKAVTHPATGSHEYLTHNAAGYFQYFGAAAGDPTKGFYSYNLGAWHVVVLNGNCAEIGGCDMTSPQVTWLQADLAAHQTLCTLAYWNQPRFSSGATGSDAKYSAFWEVLYQAGVDLVLNGHDHDYERFAPQDPNGAADPVNGIREFVVGTGGKDHTPITGLTANSEVHNDNTWGVLQLTLHPASYDWKFIPVVGGTFTDSGSAQCH